jgi:hypothetical protein
MTPSGIEPVCSVVPKPLRHRAPLSGGVQNIKLHLTLLYFTLLPTSQFHIKYVRCEVKCMDDFLT